MKNLKTNIILLLFLIMSGCYYFSSALLVEIRMDSIPYSLALKTTKNPKTFKKNKDIILFEIEHPLIPNNTHKAKLAKFVGCEEGDYLYVDEYNDYYCNFQYIGHAKTKSQKNKPLENFDFKGIIPKGYFFAIGTHINSFDSKYFGFVKNEKIESILYPLF